MTGSRLELIELVPLSERVRLTTSEWLEILELARDHPAQP
jgi:hypothetical protein